MWLKLTCLFKHRSEATEACRSGHIKLNGLRAKPSSSVKEGDLVEITDEDRYRKLVVLAIPEHSISKETGRTMYRDESPPPAPKLRRAVDRDAGLGRPTKKDRRELEKYWGK